VDDSRVFYTSGSQVFAATWEKNWQGILYLNPIWSTAPQLVTSELSIDHDQELIYVCDSGQSRISIIEKQGGKLVSSWGKKGRNPGELEYPCGILVAEELLYIVDTRLQVFTKNGDFLQLIAEEDMIGVVPRGFSRGLCMFDNRLYVTDPSNSRIQIFAPAGKKKMPPSFDEEIP